MPKPLEQEIRTFERERARLEREHAGKFALVKGDGVVATFDTFANAATEGLRLFGDEPFMIREVGAPAPRLSVGTLYGHRHADPSRSP